MALTLSCVGLPPVETLHYIIEPSADGRLAGSAVAVGPPMVADKGRGMGLGDRADALHRRRQRADTGPIGPGLSQPCPAHYGLSARSDAK